MDDKNPVSFDELDDPLTTAKPGGAAYQIYLDLVNVGRRHSGMQASVNNTKQIHQSTQTRFAVVQVLSSSTILTVGDIIPLLVGFGYHTSTSRLRGSLNRLARCGLVEKTKRYERKHGASGWNLTADGATFAISACGHHAKGKSSTHLAKGSGGTQKSSKGSSGRTSSMCNVDPSKPTLTSAVKFIIAGMLSAGEHFSAYDVTKKARVEVANLKIDPTEVGTVHVGGVDVPKIEHDAVKEIVVETFQAGEMTGYDRIHNGRYFEYKPALVPFTASVPDPSTPPDPAPAAPTGGSYDGSPTL